MQTSSAGMHLQLVGAVTTEKDIVLKEKALCV